MNSCNSEFPDLDYKKLFLQEQQKVEELENALRILDTQSKTYARELSHVFLHTKQKKRELAETNIQLVKFASDLRKTIDNLRKANLDIQNAYRDTISRLVLASEYKDNDTGSHINRISCYSILISQKLGLSEQETENIGYASPMHDVGKIGIPDNIILKNGMLTKEEFNIIKEHTTIGASILNNSDAPILQTARIIALMHHEHWNGSGYPNGLTGEKIAISARIVSISDTFDALTSKRPYKNPYPAEIACKIISNQKGIKFDPQIVDVFLSNIEAILEIKKAIDNEDAERSILNLVLSERDQNDEFTSKLII